MLNKLTIQLIVVPIVVVTVLLVLIFASKKVVIEGHECYIMPVIGTVRCGVAHKFVFGILAVGILVGAGGGLYFLNKQKKQI